MAESRRSGSGCRWVEMFLYSVSFLISLQMSLDKSVQKTTRPNWSAEPSSPSSALGGSSLPPMRVRCQAVISWTFRAFRECSGLR